MTHANNVPKTISGYWFVLPRRKNVCLLEIILSISEWKGVPHPVGAALKRDCEDVHPDNLLVYGNCLVTTIWICFSEYCWRVKGNLWIVSSHYVAPIKPRSNRSSEAFLYVGNSLHCYIYLSFFPNISRLCDRKFAFRFWARARCRWSVVVNVIVA